jgi:outer membrane protein
MKKIIIVLIPLLLYLNSEAQQKRLTLQQSVDIAIANNLDVKQSDLQVQTEAANLRQTRANILPDLFGNLNHGINQGRSIDPFTNGYINQQVNYANYNLNTNITVFKGGQLATRSNKTRLVTRLQNTSCSRSENITLNVILRTADTKQRNQLAQTRNQAEVHASRYAVLKS